MAGLKGKILTTPLEISDGGRNVLRRGGADNVSDDDLLVLEIISRAPGISPLEIQTFFLTLRNEFGEDALRAIRSGHAVFERRKGR